MNSNLENIKKILNLEINDNVLVRILFDINRYFDKDFTNTIKSQQKKLNRIFNSIDRKSLRVYYYHSEKDIINNLGIDNFPTISFTQQDVEVVTQNTLHRISIYEPIKIINSIKERYQNLTNHNSSSISHAKEWLEYYNKKRNDLYNYSTFILRINQDDFEKNNYNENYIFNIIKNAYNKLENYRHLIIFIDGQIVNKNKIDITWKLIYKSTIYCENFVQYDKEYFPCKKDKQIKTLNEFIKEKTNKESNYASEFYKNISTGFKFEDCFVSKNQNKIFISLKKIILDESAVPCPSCMTTIQSGNSYPEMFLRSFECKNPNCQDRSKSGRGKRFDEYGIYRVCKLEECKVKNVIDSKLYMNWHRDIFDEVLDCVEMILKYYTWDNENILVYNLYDISNTYSRYVISYNEQTNVEKNCKNYVDNYDNLPIVKLYRNIIKDIKTNEGKITLNKQLEIIKGDSASIINDIQKNQIGTAITSPPYYNAREYSQWQNMLLYLIDMMINAKSIYDKLVDDGKYLYNIGDIVCQENIYVKSHMSNRRLPLGFLSCMIFEIAGFNLNENIIWDKGEVQSKRNSTINLFSGYVKCINCYEHVFVFSKNQGNSINSKKVAQISPVIKINSKGENTYKHTAPYPEELVQLVKPYAIEDKYILDPFLGSGTTLIWCKNNSFKGIGIELNQTYYELAIQYINKNNK